MPYKQIFNPISGQFDSVLATPVLETEGGTGQTTYTTGDTLYASATDVLSKRTIGNTGDVLTVAGGVPTWAPAAAGSPNYAISSSSGAFNSTSASYTDVTNLSVTITTIGRPVVLKLVPDGSSNIANLDIQNNNAGGQSADMNINFVEGSTIIAETELSHFTSSLSITALQLNIPVASHSYFYVPAAGTYTYKVQIKSPFSINTQVNYAKLVAYEI